MNIPWIILYGGIFILLIVLLRNNFKKDRRCTKKIHFLSIGLFFWGLIGIYSLSGTYFDNEDYGFIENTKQKLDSFIKFQKEECLFLNF